jgi:glycosyltransferase involved in cell wall biosynthesis
MARRFFKSKAKNFGLKNATSKYVLFVDSDVELTRDVVGECVDLIKRDEKIGGVIIPEKSVDKSFWIKGKELREELLHQGG